MVSRYAVRAPLSVRRVPCSFMDKKHPNTPRHIREGVQTIVKKLKAKSELTIKTASSHIARGYVVYELSHEGAIESPLLVVCEDDVAQLAIFDAYKAWTDTLTPGCIPVYATLTSSVLAGIQKDKPCIILTTENDMSRVPSPEILQKHTVTVAPGDAMSNNELISDLVNAGYSPERSAPEPGLLARRGSIVDVFPIDAQHGYRVDFDDNTIDTISEYTPAKSSTKPVRSATILPFSLAHIEHNASLRDYRDDLATIQLDPFPPHYDISISFSSENIHTLGEILYPAAQKRTRTIDTSFIKHLKPGDYVIHLDHGIAQFEGIVEQEIDGRPAEYFKLSYAEGDRLFLPVTLAEKMEKYIGDAHPSLSRLSGGGWSKALGKARLETLSEARQLLNTHARRKLVHVLRIERSKEIEKELSDSFKYTETKDQQEAIESVYADLAGSTPMDRLVCGDVGFGKTEVAVRAAAKAAYAGYQVAVLAPTTILAQQHLDTFTERLKKTPLALCALSRFESQRTQKNNLSRLAEGSVDIIVGTHRLLSGDVEFKNLGLIIIDEEQRFGVMHKERLKMLRSQAHVLTLTATPIPRTLHMAYSGVRDISVITTPPEGRKAIETFIEPYDHNRVKEAIAREIERKGQAYYLYNNIETINVKKQELERLLPGTSIGTLHGQLPESDIARIMHEFDTGAIDVLVCSTIIENGLDLPNVNTLIVDNATQFGLSQLHQIRGRIGRGSRQAYAYFFFKRQKLTGEAEKRLAALEEAHALGSGIDLAMRDMEIRGVGNIVGKAQHGHVKSIGLGLYLRLLNQAVKEIKSGERLEVFADISVDLPIEARIPSFFEKNKERRIELYHEWALVDTREELADAREKMQKAGALPQAVENLFYVLRLKILGRMNGITAIDTIGAFGSDMQRIVMRTEEPIPPHRFSAMLEICPHWEYGTEEVKIKVVDLGKDWTKKLEATLNTMIQAKET